MQRYSTIYSVMFVLVYILLCQVFLGHCKVCTISESCSVSNESCITLNDFATDSDRYINPTSLNILLLLPGNHSLQVDLSISSAREISIVSETSIILCNTTRFKFNHIESVHIRGITFIGCGGNTVQNVDRFILEDSTFQGSLSTRTALVLNETIRATLLRSNFINFSLGTTYSIDLPNFYNTLGPIEVAGALAVLHSSVVIQQIVFEGNSAQLGSTIFADGSSSVNITDSNFHHSSSSPSMVLDYHSIFVTNNCTLDILNCSFSNNRGKYGVFGLVNSEIRLSNSSFIHNEARLDGGAIMSHNSVLRIDKCVFSHNTVEFLGGAVHATATLLTVVNSTFSDNRANNLGGSFYLKQSLIDIYNSDFEHCKASEGAVIYALADSTVKISQSSFNRNEANSSGGVVTIRDGRVEECGSTFRNNSAQMEGGVIQLSNSEASLMESTFDLNTAQMGGVISALESNFSLVNVTFSNNTATNTGGVFCVNDSHLDVEHSQFVHNMAAQGAILDLFQTFTTLTDSKFMTNIGAKGILQSIQSKLMLHGLTITKNTGQQVVMYAYQGSASFTGETLIADNIGSLYVYDGDVTFIGNTHFVNCCEPYNQSYYWGGALTIYRSIIYFNGTTTVSYNMARRGGAFITIESFIYINGETTITNNRAIEIGGGAYFYQSYLTVTDANLTISDNHADQNGGGIYAVSSIISTTAYRKLTQLNFNNNSANEGKGGGLYFEANSRLYVLKREMEIDIKKIAVSFTDNHADLGGAIYVEDDTNSGACAASTECFFQTLSLHMKKSSYLNTVNIFFSDNYALQSGNDIFGGLIDRCTPSAFAEIYAAEMSDAQSNEYNGTYYLQSISNVALDSIGSHPVRVCFCRDDLPDCHYHPLKETVKKGEIFTIQVVAVDQVGNPIATTVTTSLLSIQSSLFTGQTFQTVNESCTNLSFSVQSPQNSEKLFLHPEGPCDSKQYSIAVYSIDFGPCICPIGFDTRETTNNCDCTCASDLFAHISNCDPVSQSFIKTDSSWISYTNQTQPSGYIVHPHCPYDYCLPPSSHLRINLNTMDGDSVQCNHNRQGTLCGACKEPFTSLSFVSSQCFECRSYWPALLITVILCGIIFGILLIAFILMLNLTVTIGTINSLVFYVNVIYLQRNVFFPFRGTNYQTVILSSLNLNFPLDICFIKGMDAYTRTWLKLVFPTYLLFLVVLVIIISKYSVTFADFIGKKDPVATLATVILLSYTQLLDFIIEGLSVITVNLPDGSLLYLWLPDANVKYFLGEHAPLFIASLICLIIYVAFTFLLLTWQWLDKCRDKCRKSKVLRWIDSQKLSHFFEIYQIPYNSRVRYWTGLLLLIRVILHVVNVLNVNRDPNVQFCVTIFALSGLLLLKGLYIKSLYRKWPIDLIESVTYFNMISLAAFTSYTYNVQNGNQVAVAAISTTITFLMIAVVIIYHVYTYTSVGKLVRKLDMITHLKTKLQLNKKKTTSQNGTVSTELADFQGTRCSAVNRMVQYRSSIFEIVQPPTESDYFQPQDSESQMNHSTEKESSSEQPTFSTIDISKDNSEKQSH